jgi:hypothetical protein
MIRRTRILLALMLPLGACSSPAEPGVQVPDVTGVYMVQQVGGYDLPAGLGRSYPLARGKLVLHADGTYTDSIIIHIPKLNGDVHREEPGVWRLHLQRALPPAVLLTGNHEWIRDTLYLTDPPRRNYQGNVADQFTYLKVQ